MTYELLKQDSFGTSPKAIAPIVKAVADTLKANQPNLGVELVTGVINGKVNEYDEKIVYHNEIRIRDEEQGIDFKLVFGNREPDRTHPHVPLSELVQVDIKVSNYNDNETAQFLRNTKRRIPVGQSACGSTLSYAVGTFLVEDEDLVNYLVEYVETFCAEQQSARIISINNFRDNLKCVNRGRRDEIAEKFRIPS